MKSKWSYPDIFDLEYCFLRDRSISEAALHKRDRTIFLSHHSAETRSPVNASFLLSSWLGARRKELDNETVKILPGSAIHEAVRLVFFLFSAAGLVTGAASGLAFFSYSGTTPVNVFHFLFLFVFSQLLFALLLVIRLLLRIVTAPRSSFPLLFKLYTTCVAKITERLQHRLRSSLSAEKRTTAKQIQGLIRSTHYKYGLVLYWPVFSVIQRTLVCFNLGLLGASLFRITTSDLAFGWQSTIQLSSQSLHSIVKFLALPWSWFIPPDIGYPSLQAIEGSRIILKDGIYHLATQNLVAWWPFLLMSLVFYGLLFRLVLTVATHYYARYRLNTITFETSEALSVLRRMQSPLVSTQATTSDGSTSSDTLRSEDKIAEHRQEKAPSRSFPVWLLTAHDISEQTIVNELVSFIEQRGFTVQETKRVLGDFALDLELCRDLKSCDLGKESGIVLFLESWMPPIGEVFGFLKRLRESVDKTTPIYLGLIGKPAAGNVLSCPGRNDLQLWYQKIDGLADPHIKIIPYEP